MRQLLQYHPSIGHTYIPGLKTHVDHEGGGYLIQVNGTGFRSHREFDLRKKTGVYRVLLFGDSFTAADGVSNRHRYSDVLETLVPGIEVYNFGLPGTGTDQHYIAYREMAGAIEHDLLVIAVQVENIRRVAARYKTYLVSNGEPRVFAKPYFSLGPDGTLVRHHVPVPKEPLLERDLPAAERRHVDRGGRLLWMRRLVGRLGSAAKDSAQRLLHYQPLPEYKSSESPQWRLMKAILVQWISESRRPVVIFVIPLYQHIERTASPAPYQARFRELGEATGARIHDPLPDYWQHSRSECRGFRFPRDVHPTPASHRVLAESLARCVRRCMEEARN